MNTRILILFFVCAISLLSACGGGAQVGIEDHTIQGRSGDVIPEEESPIEEGEVDESPVRDDKIATCQGFESPSINVFVKGKERYVRVFST